MKRRERRERVKYLRRVLRGGGCAALPRQLEVLDELISQRVAPQDAMTPRDVMDEVRRATTRQEPMIREIAGVGGKVGGLDDMDIFCIQYVQSMGLVFDMGKIFNWFFQVSPIDWLHDDPEVKMFAVGYWAALYHWTLLRWEQAPMVYALDPELQKMLSETDLPRELPPEIFSQFAGQTWALKVDPELTGGIEYLVSAGSAVAGGKSSQIAVIATTKDALVSVTRCLQEDPNYTSGIIVQKERTPAFAENQAVHQLAINAALYLATEKPDVTHRPKRTKRDTFGALLEPTVVGVGTRIGGKIRAIKTHQQTGNPLDRARHSPAAHMRRGHWRLQNYGQRTAAKPKGTHTRVIWIQPSVIGVGRVNPTVRAVE